MDNRTHFVVGSGQFINNDEALLTWESFNVLTHLQNAGDAEETELKQWNEDGVIADFRFSLDTTKNVVINSLRLDLVISDGSNTITLDGVNVVLNPNIGDPPQIATNNIRNYILPPNSEFNLVKVDNDGSASPKEFYRGIIGQKITWQEWIRNNNIPALFLNLSQLNNGLNQKADNYSGENGYNVYLKATAEVTGEDSIQGTVTRTYERLSSLINVYDYFESDDGVVIDGTIETFDASETTNLNGAILPNADTLFKVTWSGPNPLDLADLGYIIHRIEPKFAPTNLQIEESSTFRGVVPTGKLTEVLTAQEGDDIVSRCFIKGGSVTNGNWKLSARFKSPGLPTAVSWILIHLTNPNGRNATFTARTKILPNNKTFFAVNNATLQADYRFRIGNTDANLTDANDGGWAAFAEIDFATFIGQQIEANVKVRVSYVGTNTTDTDLLSAIKVGTDENEIATVTNTIVCPSKIAANDILLPFQTLQDVDVVTSQFTTNKYSETRTDAEIAASSDLTNFLSGITSLVNLDIDNYGHLYLQPTTTNGIGNVNIQTTANDASLGSVVGIASPLQNLYYPTNSLGVNPPSLQGDNVNDLLFVPSGATGADLLFPENIPAGSAISYTILSRTNNFFGVPTVPTSTFRFNRSNGNLISFSFTDLFVVFNLPNMTGNGAHYVTLVVERSAVSGNINDIFNITFYANGKKTELVLPSNFTNGISRYAGGTQPYRMGCPGGSTQTQFSSNVRYFAVHTKALTPEEVRQLHLGADPATTSPDYYYDFTNLVVDGSDRLIPNLGTGTIDDAVLENHTNTLTTLFP